MTWSAASATAASTMVMIISMTDDTASWLLLCPGRLSFCPIAFAASSVNLLPFPPVLSETSETVR